jgi:threonine dehydratase
MPKLPTLAEIESIATLVDGVVPPTPQFSWPLLNARLGSEVWVKHENHTGIGSFKIRGALHYIDRLVRREPSVKGVIAATRGNFGQAVAFAARHFGLSPTIVVPHGNSVEKNRAMRGLGAELIEHGGDFQAAFEHSVVLAHDRGLHCIPAFHEDLAWGNAVSLLNFLRAVPVLDRLYFPIGMGTGICAAIAARNALNLRTEIIGVASANAPAIVFSFESRRLVTHPARTRIADGMACSTPHPDALDHMLKNVSRVVRVSDDEAEAAMRVYFADTHNVAEGAAGAGLAAILAESQQLRRDRVGVILTGGNVDAPVFARILGSGPAETPRST